MTSTFLLYGSTGFTGDLTARLAVQQGLRPILAGRSAAKLKAQAAELGLEYRVAPLDNPAALDAALADVAVVMHCAGPFIDTWQPMANACLRTGTHYLDITGELPVYAGLQGLDERAQARGVMLMPGVGFDIVPSDCLAAHLKRRLPSATRLALAFAVKGPARVSRGTAKSAIGMAPTGCAIRREGRLVTVPFGSKTRRVDFGNGSQTVTIFPWGDVFTAYYSTGIPNIEDYFAVPRSTARLMAGAQLLQPALRIGAVRGLLKRLIERGPAGPTAEQRAATRTFLWGEVTDDQGKRAIARLFGPEPGYTWTPITMLQVVRRVLDGHAPPGYQTPAKAYGPDFVLETEGVRREDVV